MALNEADKEYRENSAVRIRTRIFVGILTGIFANWLWLCIIIGLFTFGELATMYKIMTHFDETGEKMELTSTEKGEAMGRIMIAALVGGFSTLIIASVTKLLRDFILGLF